jgi:hypothetical protein
MLTTTRAGSLAALAAVAGLMTAAAPAAAQLDPHPAGHSTGAVAGYLSEEGVDIFCVTGPAGGTPHVSYLDRAVSTIPR